MGDLLQSIHEMDGIEIWEAEEMTHQGSRNVAHPKPQNPPSNPLPGKNPGVLRRILGSKPKASNLKEYEYRPEYFPADVELRIDLRTPSGRTARVQATTNRNLEKIGATSSPEGVSYFLFIGDPGDRKAFPVNSMEDVLQSLREVRDREMESLHGELQIPSEKKPQLLIDDLKGIGKMLQDLQEIQGSRPLKGDRGEELTWAKGIGVKACRSFGNPYFSWEVQVSTRPPVQSFDPDYDQEYTPVDPEDREPLLMNILIRGRGKRHSLRIEDPQEAVQVLRMLQCEQRQQKDFGQLIWAAEQCLQSQRTGQQFMGFGPSLS